MHRRNRFQHCWPKSLPLFQWVHVSREDIKARIENNFLSLISEIHFESFCLQHLNAWPYIISMIPFCWEAINKLFSILFIQIFACLQYVTMFLLLLGDFVYSLFGAIINNVITRIEFAIGFATNKNCSFIHFFGRVITFCGRDLVCACRVMYVLNLIDICSNSSSCRKRRICKRTLLAGTMWQIVSDFFLYVEKSDKLRGKAEIV